jgi:membrane protease YdiL (CAAX protease family)
MTSSISRRGFRLPDSRLLSAFEFILGAAVVIGYNVFRVIPNEVPILVALCFLSLFLRERKMSAIGFKRPASWRRILLIALGAAVLRIVLGVVVEAITAQFLPPAKAPSEIQNIQGNPLEALKWLVIVWGFASFGEEIAYRGYLLNRAADTGKRSNAAYWTAVVLVSILFGVGHFYKGPAGMIDSGMAGLILGAAYLITGRNLWTSILAHGFIDTIGLAFVYFGLAS